MKNIGSQALTLLAIVDGITTTVELEPGRISEI
jgi:hypothetical protein